MSWMLKASNTPLQVGARVEISSTPNLPSMRRKASAPSGLVKMSANWSWEHKNDGVMRPTCIFFAEEVTIKFNMFGTFMKDRIRSNVE